MAGVRAELVSSGAVHGYGKTLVLDGAGTQQGVPGQDSLVGPVGGVDHGVVVIAVAAEDGEPEVIAYEQQYPQAAELNDHTLLSGREVIGLTGV